MFYLEPQLTEKQECKCSRDLSGSRRNTSCLALQYVSKGIKFLINNISYSGFVTVVVGRLTLGKMKLII